MLTVMVDWTQVLIAGVPAYIAAIFAGIATVIVARNHRNLRDVGRAIATPSGDPIGAVTERTHDITHATNVLVRKVNGFPEDDQPATEGQA